MSPRAKHLNNHSNICTGLNELRFEVTSSCNLACIYCFYKKGKSTVDTDLFRKTIEDAIPLGLQTVSFTGGEPLLAYSTLKTLVSFVKSKGLKAGLLTNGTLVSMEKVEEFSRLGLNWVRISLDGSEEIHDSARGKGTYRKALKAASMFNAKGIAVRLRPTITRFNSDCLDDLVELAKDIGIGTLEFQHYIYSGDREKDLHFSLSPEDQIETAKHLLKLREKHKKNLDVRPLSGWFEFLLDGYEGKPEPYVCGRTFLYIDIVGNVKTCAPNNLILGNINNTSIKDLFVESKVIQDQRNYNASRYCRNCKVSKYCMPCPSPIINYFGTLNGPSPNCPRWRQAISSKVYFEDLEVGDKWISHLREPITVEEVRCYIASTNEKNKMHSQGSYAAGYQLFAVMGELSQMANVRTRRDGFFDIYSARLLRPVIVDQDRLFLIETVLKKEDRGSKRRGYVVFGRTLIKESGEIALKVRMRMQVDKRGVSSDTPRN